MTEEGRKYRLEDIFDAPSISQGITKNFCQENKGDIPVFGSSKNEQEVIGYIADKIKNIRYYKDCITYNRNGSVGYVFYRKGKFVANEDTRVLILKDHFKDKVLYDYLKYVLEIILMRNFNYSNKAGINKVMQLEVMIPSIETQNVIISKLDSIKEVKEKIILYASKITLSKVVLDPEDGVCFATVKIGKIFDIVKGKSKYTKSYMNKHKGKYPVYSSQTSDEGVIASIDSYDYDCKCLTWTSDGTYTDKDKEYKAGYVKFTKDGNVETHTIVLCKQNDKYLVIDPSNAEFSAILVGAHNDIRVCFSKKLKIYQPPEQDEEKEIVGSNPNQWRDCIDIAVKLAFNLNKNSQEIELEKFNESEVIKTDSLKDNISIEEISNNSDTWKILPGELDFYPIRSKQSSDIVDSKKIHAGLKIFHYISKQLKEKVTDLNLHYVQKAINQVKEDYFGHQYNFNEYYQSYDDLVSLSKYLKGLDEIELLGLETKIIEETFNE